MPALAASGAAVTSKNMLALAFQCRLLDAGAGELGDVELVAEFAKACAHALKDFAMNVSFAEPK